MLTDSATMDPLTKLTTSSTAESVPSDAARSLLARWAKGDDEGALDCLIRSHQDPAFRYARRVCGDADLARDVVQEAFLRVMRHHDRLGPDQSFRAWFLHIVRNLAIDALRRQRTRSAVPYEDHLRSCSTANPGDDLDRSETRRRIAETLLDLPEKYREILVMREMDGMPAEDIASIINVEYATTRWRLHKARALFREAWLRRYGTEGA